jgi:lipid-binding SYLF domain-containing protein
LRWPEKYGMLCTMKSTMVCVALLCLAASAPAVDKADLDARIRKLTFKFGEMQRQPDKWIPAETLRQAQAIILLDRTKAGFLFAFQGGDAVALVRDPGSKEWSPAAFLEASEASLGPQVGVQQSFLVFLLMTPNAARSLMEPSFEFGGEARGTAGHSSAGVEGIMTAHESAVLVFEDRQGLFGGVALKAGTLASETDANFAYYGRAVTMRDILFDRKVKPTEAAVQLANRISEMEPAVAVASAPPLAAEAQRSKTVLPSPKAATEARSKAAVADVPSPAPPTDVATERLRRLIAELHAQRQTNAVQYLHDYLSAQITSQQTADASTTLLILERLREQRTAEAIELLEARLDGALINLGAAMAATPPAERVPSPFDTLQRAREYRTEFPRRTGHTNIDDRVARAWQLQGEPKK